MTIEALQDLQALLTTFAGEFEASDRPSCASTCRVVRGWAEREEREIESAAIIPSQEELEKIRKWAVEQIGSDHKNSIESVHDTSTGSPTEAIAQSAPPALQR